MRKQHLKSMISPNTIIPSDPLTINLNGSDSVVTSPRITESKRPAKTKAELAELRK
jgi:hypothetical protein